MSETEKKGSAGLIRPTKSSSKISSISSSFDSYSDIFAPEESADSFSPGNTEELFPGKAQNTDQEKETKKGGTARKAIDPFDIEDTHIDSEISKDLEEKISSLEKTYSETKGSMERRERLHNLPVKSLETRGSLRRLEEELDDNSSVSLDSLMARISNDEDEDETMTPEKLKEFFGYLDSNASISLYSGLKIDKESAIKLKTSINSVKHGVYSSNTLICPGGTKCPIIHQCPFAKRKPNGEIDLIASEFPLLRPCPLEKNIHQIKVEQYAIEQRNNGIVLTPVVMGMISRMATLDIMEMRCDAILSKTDEDGNGANLLIKSIEGTNVVTGEFAYGVKEHPTLKIKKDIAAQRDKIQSQLIATPKDRFDAQVKMKQTVEKKDLSSRLTEASFLLVKLQEKLDSDEEVVLDVESD